MVAFLASVSARSCPGHCVHIQSNIDTVASKHAGSHPEAFWLRPVMAITASVQPESGRIVLAGSDFALPFQFRFSKDGIGHTVQNRPVSDLDSLVGVWLNSSGLKTSRCAGIIGPGFWQDETGLLLVPIFRLGCLLPQTSRIILYQPGSD